MEIKEEIKESENLVQIVTNGGSFNMPKDLYSLYFKAKTTRKDEFPYAFARVLSRASIPESLSAQRAKENPKWFEEELDDKIRRFIESKSLNPNDFLNKYQEPNDKIKELWKDIPKEILDLMSRNELFSHFSFNGIDRLTYFEHSSIGGSHRKVFNNPFMGGYSLDEKVIQDAKEKRKEEVLDKKTKVSSIGLVLFMNRPNYEYNISNNFASGRQVEKFDQSRAKLVLGDIYKQLRSPEAPEDLNEIDYLRLVVAPVQYGKDLIAVPKPVSLEFVANQKVIASTKDKKVLVKFGPKKTDIKVMDVIIDENGKEHYVSLKTKGENHTLKEIPKTPNWFENFYRRIFFK